MSSLGHIGINGVGSVIFKKISYNDGLPERVSSSSTTISGPNIHIISQVKDSQKSPTGVIRVTRSQRTTLLAIYENSSPICDFDDGENSFKGYLKNLSLVDASNDIFQYRFTFMVTSKVK